MQSNDQPYLVFYYERIMEDSVRKAIFAKRVNKIVENNIEKQTFGMDNKRR